MKRLSEDERKSCMDMIRDLLSLKEFNGKRLAASLGMQPKVLSRRKKDGACSVANYRELTRIHEYYFLHKAAEQTASSVETGKAASDAVDAYRAYILKRICSELGDRLCKDGLLIAICEILVSEPPPLDDDDRDQSKAY